MNDHLTPADAALYQAIHNTPDQVMVQRAAEPAEPPTLNDIERRAKFFAIAREDLSAMITALNDGIQALQREAMPDIKRAIARASEHQVKLDALLQQCPNLFIKPRTTIFHGIKLGYQKTKDGLEYDPEMVIQQVKEKLPEKASGLIRTKEELVPEALKLLTADERKAVGITDVEGKDKVVITPTDSAIDKAVTALLKAAVGENEAKVEG